MKQQWAQPGKEGGEGGVRGKGRKEGEAEREASRISIQAKPSLGLLRPTTHVLGQWHP